MRIKYGFLFVVVFLASLLLSCGQPVCVMAIGDCQAPEKPVVLSTLTLTSNFLTIRALPANGPTSAVITITGGNAPYAISISGGSIAGGVNAGYFLNSNNIQVSSLAGVNSTTVTFFAYTTVSTTQTVTLKVVDSSATALEKTIELTVSP